MPEFTETELARARAAVDALLGDLGLAAHLYAVEPKDGAWVVVVECATRSGWQRTELQVGTELLDASFGDPGARAVLLAHWRERLAACKTE